MHSQRCFADTSYEGERDHCQRPSGLGRLICKLESENIVFTGQLRRGIAEGHGVLRLPDDNVFAGQFVDGSIKGYGVYTTQSGTEIKGFFSNNDIVTVEGAVHFSDGTTGIPFHEGVFSESTKFDTTEKCPDQLALAQDSADRAFQLEKSFENKENEANADAADTASLSTNSNILELDELAQVLTDFESECIRGTEKTE